MGGSNAVSFSLRDTPQPFAFAKNYPKDESRPICRRCQRLNLPCDGPRGIAFIHEKPKPAPPSAPPKIAGFDVYICYTQSHLLRDGLIVSAITDTRADDLMPLGTAVASRQVSHQAIMSFATLLFGIQHRQPDISRQGYAMHGVALRQVNQVLSDTTRQTRDEVILAVAALAITELLVPTGPGNYWKHMMGLERLVDLQDPASFWSTRSSGFCKGVRFMIVAAALKLGRPSILARPDWKKAVRANASDEVLEEQDLYDVLADCSVLLAERDAMASAEKADPTEANEQRDGIARRACGLLEHLRQWRQRWDRKNLKDPVADTAASPSRPEESQPTHNDRSPEGSLITATTIPNIPAAAMLMLYDLAVMFVSQSLQPLPPLEESAATRTTRNVPRQFETAKSYQVDERDAAREVCRCTRYYLSIRRRLDASAPLVIHWAIAVAWERLRQDDSAEGVWMRDLLSRKGRQVVAEGLWTTYKWLNSLPE
jgi:hypothetical protein